MSLSYAFNKGEVRSDKTLPIPGTLLARDDRLYSAPISTTSIWVSAVIVRCTGGSKGGRNGPCPPCHVGKRPECTKSRHFQTQNAKKILRRGQCPLPRPQLVFLCINHNLVSNTLVLSPRAICIHTTASFPTSNGFLRLKRFKQSMEE